MSRLILSKMGLLTAGLLSISGMVQVAAAKEMPTEVTIEKPITTSHEHVPQILPQYTWQMRPMTEAEFTSAMCVLGAATSMTATYMVGPNEVIMLVVGGVVIPSSPSILFLSLFGTMAAAGCTIGSLSTPAVNWLYQHWWRGGVPHVYMDVINQ